MGFWPIAWQSPMLALMTSVNGLFTPYIDGVVNGKGRKTKRMKERETGKSTEDLQLGFLNN